MGHLALGGADLHLLSDVVGRLGRRAGRVLQHGRPDPALRHSRIAVWANRRIQDVLRLLRMRATSLGTSFAAATTSSTTAATAVALAATTGSATTFAVATTLAAAAATTIAVTATTLTARLRR